MAEGQDFAGVTKTLRDAAYVLVGLGLMGLSRARASAAALQAKLSSPDVEQTVAAVRQQVTERARSVDVDAALAALRRQMAERAPSVDVDATLDEGRARLVRRAHQLDGLVELAAAFVESSLAPSRSSCRPPPARRCQRVQESARAARALVRERIPEPPADWSPAAGTISVLGADSQKSSTSRRVVSRGISGFQPVAALEPAGVAAQHGYVDRAQEGRIGDQLELGPGQGHQPVGDLGDGHVVARADVVDRARRAPLDQQAVGPDHVADVGEVPPSH